MPLTGVAVALAAMVVAGPCTALGAETSCAAVALAGWKLVAAAAEVADVVADGSRGVAHAFATTTFLAECPSDGAPSARTPEADAGAVLAVEPGTLAARRTASLLRLL